MINLKAFIQKKGMTLLEVMLVMIMLGAGLLLLMRSSSYSSKNNTSANDYSRRTEGLTEVLDRLFMISQDSLESLNGQTIQANNGEMVTVTVNRFSQGEADAFMSGLDTVSLRKVTVRSGASSERTLQAVIYGLKARPTFCCY